MRLAAIVLWALAVTGCASAEILPRPATASSPTPPPKSAAQRGVVRSGTPDGVNIALARSQNRTRAFTWMDFGPEAFEKAKREHKLILLDGAAEWCHWCHVMDETTYADPEVGKVLAERFVTVRVDVDARPDLAERYGDYGWPATILFSPDAEEVGKYRGYLPKQDLLDILKVIASVKAERERGRDPFDVAPPIEALPWLAGRVVVDMDGYFDPDLAGWGRMQKSPLGQNITFELRRAAHGDGEAKKRALATLTAHRALLDPVWGGVYQYSAGKTWNEPHYEKLMTYQAWNLEAYARGYALTKDPALLADARSIARYLNGFLSNSDGAFLVTQDADVNAHDAKSAFVDGDVYYRLDDAHRRALGVPRVDDHVYAHENGLAITAFVALFEASGDTEALARARKAADWILKTKVDPGGEVRREAKGARYLADAASFGYALARLAQVTRDPAYREAAIKIARVMLRDFADGKGPLADRTADPAAAGVFAKKLHPFVHDILAARFLAALATATGDVSFTAKGKELLAATCTPKALDERGRMLGEVLLTLDDLGAVSW